MLTCGVTFPTTVPATVNAHQPVFKSFPLTSLCKMNKENEKYIHLMSLFIVKLIINLSKHVVTHSTTPPCCDHQYHCHIVLHKTALTPQVSYPLI